MISLTQGEEQVHRVLCEAERELVAVDLPEQKKGERVLPLVAGEIDPDALRKALIDAGLYPLTILAEIRPVEQVPKLGSGKTDFAGARRLAAAA